MTARHTKLVWNVLSGILAAAAVWLLFGLFLSFGWHVLHHDSISYLGWRIPVPKRSYVTHDRIGPSIWTLSPGAPLFNLPYGRITFDNWKTGRPFSKDRDYPPFSEGVRQAAAQSGHQMKSTRAISLGQKSVYCVEFARERRQPISLMRCAIDDSDVLLFYEGDPRYIPDVFNTIRGMSPEPQTFP